MSAESLKDTLNRWAAELADPDTDEMRVRQIKDWAVGASIALMAFGHDDLAAEADEIWNPRRPK